MLILPAFLLFLGGLILTPAPQLVADTLDNYTSAFWIAYVARPTPAPTPAPTGPVPVTSLSLYAPFVLAPPPPPPPAQPAKPPFLAPAPVPLAFAHIALCETTPGQIPGPHELPQLDAAAQRTLDTAALWMAVALVSSILGAASAASPSSKAAVCEEPVATQSDEVPEFFIIAQQSAAEEMVDLIYSSNETSPISSPVLDPADPEQTVEDHIIDEIPTTDNTDAHVPVTPLDTIWFHGLTDAANDDVDDEQFIYPDSDSAAEDDYVPGVDADDEQFVYPNSDSAAEDDCAPGVALAGVASEEATSTPRRDDERRDDTADVDVHPSADNAQSSGLEASIYAPGNKAPLSAVQSARSALPDADPGSDASVPVPAPDPATNPAPIPTQEATLHGPTAAPRPSPPAHDKEPTRGAALAELAHAYMPSCPQTSIWDQNTRANSTSSTSMTTPPPSPPRAKTRRSRRKGKGRAVQESDNGAPPAPDVASDAADSVSPDMPERSACAGPAEPAALARGRVMEDVESRPRTSRRRRDVRSLSPSPASARSAPRVPMASLALPAGLYERAWALDR